MIAIIANYDFESPSSAQFKTSDEPDVLKLFQ